MNNSWRDLRTFIVLILLSPWMAMAQEVVIHEAGPVHMESAGGWVAIEKGLYGGLKVKGFPGNPGASPIQKVVEAVQAGKIAFGIEMPETILRAREKEGIDLVALSVDFQNSAMRIISWHPIRSSFDLRGDFGIWNGYEARVKSALGKGWEKRLRILTQGEDIKPWLAGIWPMASAMTYNELITAQREVKKMGKKFYTIDYKDLGIDWMDNILFTTGEIVRKYPEIVQAIVTGRYRGFQWAFDHPKETFELLRKIDEGLGFMREMDALSSLKPLMITAETKREGYGYIYPKKWEKVAKDMFRAGLLERVPDVRKIYTERFPSGVLPK